MLRTETDIIQAYKERWDALEPLRNRQEFDHDLWRLEDYELGSAYDNYTSNEPRTLADKIIEYLSFAPLQVNIPIGTEDDEEEKKKANAEKFIYGALNLANFRLEAAVQPLIQPLLAWHTTLRGWAITRAYIHKKEKGGETIVDVQVWDSLRTMWAAGSEGLLWVCNFREITIPQAKAEFEGVEIKTNWLGQEGKNWMGRQQTIKVYDFWDTEINAIIVGDEFWKKPTNHELKHVPVFILPVGSTPFVQSTKHTDTIKDEGESVYAANRNLFEVKNKLYTQGLTIVGQAAHNPLAIYSEGGKKTFEKSPYYAGSIIQLDVSKQEKVEGLYKPEIPKDLQVLIMQVARDLSLGGQPPIAGGELNFQLPYSAVNLLIEAARSILLPRQDAEERTYEWLGRELLTQYASGGFRQLRLRGRVGTNEFFDVKLSSKDVKGDWFPEAKLLPALPENKPQMFAMAQTAVQNEIFSKEWAREFLGSRDPEVEEEKILREKAERMPSVMIRKLASALERMGRPDLAQVLMEEFMRMEQGGTQSPGQGEEAINPEFATGMPNTAVTPEEMGRIQKSPGEREQFEGDELARLGLEE